MCVVHLFCVLCSSLPKRWPTVQKGLWKKRRRRDNKTKSDILRVHNMTSYYMRLFMCIQGGYVIYHDGKSLTSPNASPCPPNPTCPNPPFLSPPTPKRMADRAVQKGLWKETQKARHQAIISHLAST